MKKGFTLIELMVVVIIIAALAGMVLPHVLPASTKARLATAEADIAGISTALKLYRLNNDRYPTTQEGLALLRKADPSKGWNEPYLEKDPNDPWDRPYQYQCPGTHNTMSYDLWSSGPDEQDSSDDVGNW